MMRIKVFFDKNLKILKIPVGLIAPHKRIPSDIVVDTGCPDTILNYSDSRRLGIPYTTRTGFVKIGGKVYQSYTFKKFKILFKSTNNEIIEEDLPIKIIRPNSASIDEIEELDDFPNLLGLDLLEEKYRFVCDINKEEIYLEKVEISQKEDN